MMSEVYLWVELPQHHFAKLVHLVGRFLYCRKIRHDRFVRLPSVQWFTIWQLFACGLCCFLSIHKHIRKWKVC